MIWLRTSLVYGATALPSDDRREAFNYPGVARGEWSFAGRRTRDWFFTCDGFGYLDPAILHEVGCDSVVIAKSEGNDLRQFVYGPTILLGDFESAEATDKWLRSVINLGRRATREGETRGWYIDGEELLLYLKRRGVRVLIPDSVADRVARFSKGYPKALVTEWSRNGWRLLQVGNCPPARFDFGTFTAMQPHDGRRAGIVECYLDLAKKPAGSPVGRKWLEILRTAQIPYDLQGRREKLAHAYDDLAAYIVAHEHVKRQGSGSPST